MAKRAVFTGGPGSGKTTILKSPELNTHYMIFDEIARQVLAQPGNFAPEGADLQPVIERLQLNDYHMAEQTVRVGSIYDRGIPDQLAYRRYLGLDIPDSLLEACDKYRYDKIFYFPFWSEIYEQDSVRKEDEEEARAIGAIIRLTYELQGYEVINVPKATPQERVNFIMSKI